MAKLASITKQGQLTIPKEILRSLGIAGSHKAKVSQKGKQIIVEPIPDFWQLGGSLQSSVSLTEKQMNATRKKFSTQWSRKR